MMKRQSILVLVTTILLFFSISPQDVEADIYFDDGQTHNINYPINEDVWVDYQAPGMQTTANWLDGATTPQGIDLRAYQDSTVNFSGGWLGDDLWALQNSKVTVSGGTVDGILFAGGHSRVTIYFMALSSALRAFENTQVSVFGGKIGGPGSEFMVGERGQVTLFGGQIRGPYRIDGNGTLTIHGSDFRLDGQSVGYGELTSVLGGFATDDPSRHLTGTLASGEPIDNDFYIGHDAKIVLTPVPGAVILGSIGLAFAGWRLRRENEKEEKL